MRYLSSIILVLFLSGAAVATDLGTTFKDTKTDFHIGMNSGTPDGREGGEDIYNAFVITSLPFDDTGNTSDNIDDYEGICPYGGSASPDVVYSYTPTTDEVIRVDLCGSSYDTNTHILTASMEMIACNDDYYFNNDECGEFVSCIERANLTAGTEYFIIVDGYGSQSGDYILNVRLSDPLAPWPLSCDGMEENEPPFYNNYHDAFNGGCNSPEYGNPFGDLTQAGDGNGDLEFCGVTGWYESSGSPSRDTDWMYMMIGESGTVEWTLEAEYDITGFLLTGDCSDGPYIAEEINFTYQSPVQMTIQGDPEEIFMIWVGPSDYYPQEGMEGNIINYKCTFSGLSQNGGQISTDSISFDAIKSLYR